jgi:hypothetical protein
LTARETNKTKGEKTMRITFNLLCCVLMTLFLTAWATAQEGYGKAAIQDGLREIEVGKALSQMPEIGAKPEDFVPPHWAILQRVEGDMNADGIKDWAFILAPDEKDTNYMQSLEKLDKDPTWIDTVFIIAVVDSRGDRKMHLGEINYQLLGDSGASVRNGDGRDEFRLEMKKNVLDVIVSTGGQLRNDTVFHFRQDPPTGGFLTLIGLDIETYCVTITNDCGKGRVSDNYLTNTRVTTDYKVRGDNIVGTDRKSDIRPVKVSFLNARLNHSNEKGDTLPY